MAWLFSGYQDRVTGIYSEAVTKDILSKYDTFIVEINWFVELYEFSLITQLIKKVKPQSKILFGGLYGQLKYREIFQFAKVDYFIKGFNEKPMQRFLNGENPRDIPNFVGRDFENDTTLLLNKDDLRELIYDLSWFPDYFDNWAKYPAPNIDLDPDFSSMPLYPSYNYPKVMSNPEKEFRIPSKGGRYHLPMIITSRGGCSSIHEGCDYCMGAKVVANKAIYNQVPLIYDNDTLISHLTQISKEFPHMTLYINSPFEYDFSNHFFDIDCTIEIDTVVTPLQLKRIVHSFRESKVHLALYEKGHHGKKVLQNYKDFLEVEDENHKIYFFSFKEDAESMNIPHHRRLYSEFVFPKWTEWKFYNDFEKAYAYSKRFYFITRQYHLYPQPMRIFLYIRNHIILLILFILNKLGLFHPENEMS